MDNSVLPMNVLWMETALLFYAENTQCQGILKIRLLNPCNVVAQLVTSQPVTEDMTKTFFSHSDVSCASRITRKLLASSIVHSALEHILCRFPLLHNLRLQAIASDRVKIEPVTGIEVH